MTRAMLTINNIIYRIGGRLLFENASAAIPDGHRVGLIGRNGAGKSTLLKLIEGALDLDGGSISVGRRTKVGSVAQEMPDSAMTPLDFVLSADVERAQLLAESETATDPVRIAEVHLRLADIGAETAPSRAASILAGLGFDEPMQGQKLGEFSGGWRMRVALAATLFAAPDLLLLDEPSNHLDMETRLWLETYLTNYQGTVLLVSHDRSLLNVVAESILHLKDGELTLYRGNYDRFERTFRERLVHQAAAYSKQVEQRAKMQAFVDRFRAQASKARQAQSRLKAMERLGELAPLRPDHEVAFDFPDPVTLPPPLLTLDKASVGYEADRPVLRNLDLSIDMEDRIALLGANGNGKTTFLRLLTGDLTPMDGQIRRSSKLRFGYFAQELAEAFDLDATPLTMMTALLPDASESVVRSHLGRYGFTQDHTKVRIGSLSGGEKARLLFASITRNAPHVLLLDEPTNHLDIDARDALISAINAYQGAVILVTHDPHLVELCADRLWVVRDGGCHRFDGDMDDYRKSLVDQRRQSRSTARQRNAEEGDSASVKSDRKASRRAGAEARRARSQLRKAATAATKILEKLTSEKKTLVASLSDPVFYKEHADEFTALNKRHAAIESEIEVAEAQWLEAQSALEEDNAA
jgi:ATP-binding cassette, subfamily F, member 3